MQRGGPMPSRALLACRAARVIASIAIALGLAIGSSRAYGQAAPWVHADDEIELRDGTRVTGQAIDVRLGAQATVRLASGELRVVLWPEILRARGPGFDAAARPATAASTRTVPLDSASFGHDVAQRYLTERAGVFPAQLLSDGAPLMISAIVEAHNLTNAVNPVPEPDEDPMPLGSAHTMGRLLSTHDPIASSVRTEYLCTTPCTVHLPAGRTSIHVGGIGRVESIQTVEMDARGRRVVLYSSSSAAFGGGVVLTLIGAALGIVGTVAFALEGAGAMSPRSGTSLTVIGALAVGAGSIAIAAGIPIAVRARVGIARSEPLIAGGVATPSTPRAAVELRAGIAPVRDGWAGSLAIVF